DAFDIVRVLTDL
ncbi:hypothetical protein D030_5123B, partial [Vibrio parahaemolyticus AQ3810]